MKSPRLITGVPPGHQAITVVSELRSSLELDPWLSILALSKYCGLSRRTLQKYLVRPSSPLPHIKLGGKILVKVSEFDRWAEQFRRDQHELDGALQNVLQKLRIARGAK